VQQQIVLIREDECIGCNKCVVACPVDAIVGAMGWAHTVISDECIGCKLCLPPCPVDCIDLIQAENSIPKAIRAEKAKQRYSAKVIRQAKEQKALPEIALAAQSSSGIKQDIKAVMERVKAKVDYESN